MRSNLKIKTLAIAMLIPVVSVVARENVGGGKKANKGVPNNKVLAGCSKTTAQTDLNINNVRTTILTGGDMWWDLSNAKYEIPINSDKHSVFAGSIWVGGYDGSGNLKVAGQTYRQNNGNDFWAGPISSVNGVIDVSPLKCEEYDKHAVMTKAEVSEFRAGGPLTAAIQNWPGNGVLADGELQNLAPFEDLNGDLIYQPENGEYPRYYLGGAFDTDTCNNAVCDDYVFGDKTLWWVFNDVGGEKTETTSLPIGLEIRAQAFGFATNDAINNMTFYKYQVINRSNSSFDSTYFGQWIDPDLGEATDDYVGCDVGLGLGFVYNADNDDNSPGYGVTPPALGVDFFQGPKANPGDGVDNDKDGTVDECGEQIIMSNFLYYDNINNSPFGNPNELDDYYQYLSGSWADGNPWTYGGTGYNPGSTDIVSYIFPGTSDPTHPGLWDEVTAGNVAGDRRFLQSAGAFDLLPGAVNYITVGLVWARAASGDNLTSLALVKQADIIAQGLFDNCFRTLDGPNAPELEVRELDKKLILTYKNTENEFVQNYSQVDITIPPVINQGIDTTLPSVISLTDEQRSYKFQGFKLYQVKDHTIAATEEDLTDITKAKLIYRSDIKDDVDQLSNHTYETGIGYTFSKKTDKNDPGANTGIRHSFVIETDQFTGQPLINHKAYYFIALSYAYNNYIPFKELFPQGDNFTQLKPYLQGRLGPNGAPNRPVTGIPHEIAVENGGTILNSEYGQDGIVVTRIEGQGNGGRYLDMVRSSRDQALNPPYFVAEPVYELGKTPVNITVVDPLVVKSVDMDIKFEGVADSSKWNARVTSQNPSSVDSSIYGIGTLNEELLITKIVDPSDGSEEEFDWGLTARISQAEESVGPVTIIPGNGFLGSSISFSNGNAWLSGIVDTDGGAGDRTDWIASDDGVNALGDLDPEEVYENVIGGTWAPYKLTYKPATANSDTFGLKYPGITETNISLFPYLTSKTSLASVDIVITTDKSKWTRCPVVETGNNVIDSVSTQSGTVTPPLRFDLRDAPSVDKNGRPFGDPNANAAEAGLTATEGMGWFPGYAVNIDNGERLNMAFGENSALVDQNGADMIWNPTTVRTADLVVNGGDLVEDYLIAGGMHYIYVFGHNDDRPAKDVTRYDEGAKLYSFLSTANVSQQKKDAWKDAMWVSQPVLNPGYSFNGTTPPGDVEIKIRIAKKYRKFATTSNDTTFVGENSIQSGVSYFVIGGTNATVTYNGNTYSVGTSFDGTSGVDSLTSNASGGAVVATQNGANPYYKFSLRGLEASLSQTDVAKSALDKINVVPNPYYAYSSYENEQNENWVKFTNLPQKCKIRIYTLNGTLVRTINRDADFNNSNGAVAGVSDGTEANSGNYDTSEDWNLKNNKGVPIASGVYLIHIEAPNLGERTLKWFGVMRPIDLDSY